MNEDSSKLEQELETGMEEYKCRICQETRNKSFFSEVDVLRSNVKYCCSVKDADGLSCLETAKARIEKKRSEGMLLF